MQVSHSRPVPIAQVLFVFLLFAVVSVLCHQTRLDLWFAQQFYHLEGGSVGPFPWRSDRVLYNFCHEGGRWLVKRMFFITLAMALLSSYLKPLKRYRSALWFVVFATFLSTSLISWLKGSTTIPCPKDLIEFGGNRQWVDFRQLFSSSLPSGKCYPAGHASSGYAWLCLAFLFPYRSRSFYLALLPGVFLGIVFGFAQQLRGAHFFSHDCLTIALSWLISGVVFFFFRFFLNRYSGVNFAVTTSD